MQLSLTNINSHYKKLFQPFINKNNLKFLQNQQYIFNNIINKNDINKKYFSSYYEYDNSNSTGFGYDFNIEIPIPSASLSTTTNVSTQQNHNNNIINNHVNTKSNIISPIILEKLPKKIKISRNKKIENIINNNNNNNNDNDNNNNNNNNDNNNNSNINKINQNLKNEKINVNNSVNNETKPTTNKKTKSNKNETDDLLEIEDFKLTDEQEKIVDLIVNGGKNVFFTGSAGTGKSFILQRLVLELRKKYPKSVFITAATGIAENLKIKL
ncbi:hypothetical protein DICPUDRAFT_97281 [Dictyostelium purpureum]|uniref:ATP-dependent DNA helicase n=1 Tax=Dictyostelium purpureum TaxID=5786 RepID=F0ZFC6_DICPU|nr:uncharacterized protein DICPUDRAFT_97281 [Dictyostelium purpureum]EGC37360.1 hypothetical protein DICPUDRAFT_97281 [Dictyostelium purpureum]|eukprot:XP_003286101.1 hypothetical protein DICPUDRAFT_97281 [Dictyostelium purpureum]